MEETLKIEKLLHYLTNQVATTFNLSTLDAIRVVCLSSTLAKVEKSPSLADGYEQLSESLIEEIRNGR